MANTEDKVCIICRKIKKDFNKEHVFPATLGGGFVIELVCGECNKLLGDKIDTPFTNHKHILLYRHKYNLNRQARSIKNPFGGVFKDASGNEFVVTKDDEKFTAEFHPAFTIKEGEHGPMGLVSVSTKFIGSEDDLIEKYKREFEIITGKPVSYHILERTEPSHAIEVEVIDSDNKIILGCLKIGYEFAVACIPEYFDDELAIAYSEMLMAGSINREFRDYLAPNLSLTPVIDMNFEKFPELKEYHCMVMIEVITGIGLLACIKMFDRYHSFILSKREDYLDERILLLLNDSTNKQSRSTFLKGASSVSLNFGNLPKTETPVLNPEEPIRFYNTNCMVAAILDEKGTVPIFRSLDYKLISKACRIEDFPEGLFVKCSKTGKSHLVHSIIFNYT